MQDMPYHANPLHTGQPNQLKYARIPELQETERRLFDGCHDDMVILQPPGVARNRVCLLHMGQDNTHSVRSRTTKGEKKKTDK